MTTFVFSGTGLFLNGFDNRLWAGGGGDVIGVVQANFSASHSATHVTYGFGANILSAFGSFPTFDASGDPTSGTIQSFFQTGFSLSGTLTANVTGLSLSVATVNAWIAAGNADALNTVLIGGNDTITGTSAPDILYGFGGSDTINGGDGDDEIRGESLPTPFPNYGVAGNDILNGGAGGDQIFGDDGNDTLNGGADNDQLDGGAGNDTLNGDDGDDVLSGGAGVNLLFGGAGNDAIAGAFSGATADGGDGTDSLVVDLSTLAVGVTLDYAQMRTNVGVTLGDGTVIRNMEAVAATTGAGDDVFVFENSWLAAGPFNSSIRPSANGGAGVDLVIADLSPSTRALSISPRLLGFVQGSDGAGLANIERLSIIGSAFGDSMLGGVGDDTLDGGAGADVLFGEAGDDILIGGGGADALDGGAGAADWAEYGASAAGVNVNLQTGAASGGDAAGDTLTNIEYLRGSGLADTLTGNTLNNWLFGGAGGDGLNGGDGADLLQGEGDADTLSGEGGIDSLAGGDGDDVLIGGAGADSLGGGAGIDTADYAASLAVNVNLQTGIASGGDAAGDTFASVENIIGSAFADTLTGRDGFANTLTGGDGNDVLSGGTGGADVMNGGAGIDTLDYSLSPNGVDVRLFSGAAAGGSANGDSYSSIENIIGAATKTDTLAGDANANSIWGGGGNETITGRENTDTLYGEAGNDTLLGGADSDVLIGGIGADTLGGGSQDDTADYSASDAGVTVNLQTGSGVGGHAQGDVLVSIEDVIGSAFADLIIGKNNAWDNIFDGRGGDDTYTGGLGNDVFVFRLSEGADTITDFVAGGTADAVQLAGFGAAFDSFAEIIAAATQIGADTIIDFGGGQTLTLQNVALANLSSGDFIFGGP
ncbi:MAG: calcium-binding protein [Terricaulis sp.]